MYLGVKAVVAKSIERIHQANLCNFGILPLIFERESDYDKLKEGDELVIKGARDCVESGKFELFDVTENISIPLTLFASPFQKEMLLAGGRLNLLKESGK